MNDKVKELIKLYEAILHGKEEKMGLFDCYDNYYVGCWDEQLKEVENLKQELDIKDAKDNIVRLKSYYNDPNNGMNTAFIVQRIKELEQFINQNK